VPIDRQPSRPDGTSSDGFGLIAFTHQGAMAPYVNWKRYGRHLVGPNPAPPVPPGR